MTDPVAGLSLIPFRALRPAVDSDRLGRLLCPPYDVIDDTLRASLLSGDRDNAVALILPRASAGADPYEAAAVRLGNAVADGLYTVDDAPALYVYEMTDHAGSTRGLLGAVVLRDPADGVIAPHENTMAGPVADRLALMTATEANLEPIYLVYDGGGAASRAVREIDSQPTVAEARTPDGVRHRLWAITDAATHAAIAEDLAERRALIADGHHRYATYRELQARYDHERGPGPWDRGLTLLVDSSDYGPQVHAIHRVLVGQPLSVTLDRLNGWAEVSEAADPQDGLRQVEQIEGFAAVVADAERAFVIIDAERRLRDAATQPGDVSALADLDVSVLHRALVTQVWGLPDTIEQVAYAHSVAEATAHATASGGTAVLLRATPVAAVAAVAAAGGRMPRKSTLFTPKPASGLVMRRFVDEHPGGEP
ncbi:MAG: DUF1015 domain-containing protein [Jatrophihabitantaceae bacterium]